MIAWCLAALLSLLVQPGLTCDELPIDCEEIYNNGTTENGVYTIFPAGPEKPIEVYCDMACAEDESSSGQWIVLLRRMDGSVNFYRPWQDYKDGFGNKEGEFWLGLQNMVLITFSEKYELKVEMEDFEKNKAYAQYSSFSVDPEVDGYKLHVSGFTNGGAGDSLSYHNGMNFSTFDKDQDLNSPYWYYYWYYYNNYNCAENQEGGFWYNSCFSASPTGIYKWGSNTMTDGMLWTAWKGQNYSLKKFVMKIKRLSLAEVEG
ncbi:microfibril-associated glycoprotein 4-like [Denticeps clupeoides]|uniref:Fibrinogen C-terminal domain-containing protein n=1 Tax=Denticeps clupeoides TaxID=299321 RepID=A0AAY4AMC4_9TELE|nr:microfibril-associated glycoprotein 4-like [Denticeps clupeoides]